MARARERSLLCLTRARLSPLRFSSHSFAQLRMSGKVVSEVDGYQPHLIAPKQGFHRLIEGALSYFKGPAETYVDVVSHRSLGFKGFGEEIYRRDSG